MTIEKLQQKYKKHGRQMGSIFLLPPDIALEFIDDCQRLGYHLLGVEGFKLFGDKIQPFQEHSNDIAETTLNFHAFYEETKEFLRERLEVNLWFEVVVTEPKHLKFY